MESVGGHSTKSPDSAPLIYMAIGGLVVWLAQALPAEVQAPGGSVPPRTAADDGFTDTPMLPGMPWHVHDPARPHPPVVTPGATAGAAPSDAVVLFDGRDLSRWAHHGTGADSNKLLEPKWVVRDGYFETGARTGSLYTRESFSDVQLHVEWSAPSSVTGNSQGRGNSGIFLMGLYEIQVLDSYNNKTYADGQAGAIYGQSPPLANSARKPGEWQTYDIVFTAPRFGPDGKVQKPAYVTVLHNGVLVQNHTEILGSTHFDRPNEYAKHPEKQPLVLMYHGNPVRFRNIWVREFKELEGKPGGKKGPEGK
jgi:hypothetical protein